MARARNLKPGFFANEHLCACQPLARILFEGLWCWADREGRLEDRPARLKAQVLPYDDCDVNALLDELAGRGFILRYTVDGMACIQVLTFAQHQNPHHREPASTLPAPAQPQASPGPAQGQPQSSPSLALPLPSNGFPLPVSPFPLPEHPIQGKTVPAPSRNRPLAEAKKGQMPASIEAWTAYEAAYLVRYGTAPVRNAKTNAQFAQLAKRLPAHEVAAVASWYVGSHTAMYVRSKHCPDLLLRDCEGLRTEWATQTRVSSTQAQQADAHQAAQDAARWVQDNLDRLRAARRVSA
jgi:hypothetical protein